MMRKYFFTGLAILLPLVFTVLLSLFIIRLLTQPFTGIMESLLDYYNWTGYLAHPQLLSFVSTILSLLFFVVFVLLIGVATEWLFLHYVISLAEKIFDKIPLVNKIYRACQDVVKHLFYSERSPFSQVVLVPYPFSGILAIGLITRDAEVKQEGGARKMISVFVPATPNPTMGFLLMFEEKQIIFTDMKVSQAMQMVVSCGAKIQPFSLVQTKGDKHEE